MSEATRQWASVSRKSGGGTLQEQARTESSRGDHPTSTQPLPTGTPTRLSLPAHTLQRNTPHRAVRSRPRLHLTAAAVVQASGKRSPGCADAQDGALCPCCQVLPHHQQRWGSPPCPNPVNSLRGVKSVQRFADGRSTRAPRRAVPRPLVTGSWEPGETRPRAGVWIRLAGKEGELATKLTARLPWRHWRRAPTRACRWAGGEPLRHLEDGGG